MKLELIVTGTSFLKKVIKKLNELNRSNSKKVALQKALWLGLRLTYRYLKELHSRLRVQLKLPYPLNMDRIEIEITSDCNCRCFNCDRSCRQAPSNQHMTIDQINQFIGESIELNKKWEQIRILGGEPTLHPDIIEICNLLLEYKKKYSQNTCIILFTNGYGSRVNSVLKTIPEGIKIRNSERESQVHLFSSYNIAPIDLKEFQEKKIDYSKGCPVIEGCGLGLTRYGYYPCGAGASADRIFGWDIGIKNLSLVKRRALRGQLRILCKYCGHYKDWGRLQPEGGPILVREEKMSNSWVEAYQAYKEKKQKLSLY